MSFFNEEEEQYNRTLTRFEGMLKSNKVLFFDSDEFEDIILHYLDLGKNILAKKALKLALDQHPNASGLKLVEIEILTYEDKLDQAEMRLNELQQFEPTNEEIYIQRATIFSKKGKHELAIQQLNIALKFSDDYAYIYSSLGMEYLFLDDFENARTNFIKCLEYDLEDQSALYNIIYCYEFLEENQQAIDYLEQYIDQNPYSEIAWHQIGRLNYGLEKYDEAIRAFEFATYIDDQFLGAYMELGKSYEKLKKYELAIEYYTKTLVMEDPTSYAYLKIGKCHEQLGNKQLALKFYNKTVHEDPLLDKGWIAITDFYLNQKNYKKALFYVTEALSIDNQNAVYWRKYATISRKMNLLEEAEFGYRKAVECGDLQLETWLYWIDIIQFQGEFDMAIDTLLLASEYFPENFEIEYRLAGLYFMLKKTVKAKFHIACALRLNINGLNVLEEIYPFVWEMKTVQEIISKFKKSI